VPLNRSRQIVDMLRNGVMIIQDRNFIAVKLAIKRSFL
jgi:hypothetical protein